MLLTGTGRSGTTLVKRLLLELPGLTSTPFELNAFAGCLTRLVLRHGSTVRRADAVEAVARYARRPEGADLALDPAGVMGRLHPGPRVDVLDLYAAIVSEAMPAGAPVLEKSTLGAQHWVGAVVERFPELVAVAVVRDPRAVAASVLRLGWAETPATVALRWADEQRSLLAQAGRLGTDRLVIARYEDVIADPVQLQRRVAGLAGLPEPDGTPADLDRVYDGAAIHPHVSRPVDPSLAGRWVDDLTPHEEAEVLRRCRPAMEALGYDTAARARATAPLSPRRPRLVRSTEVLVEWEQGRRSAVAATMVHSDQHAVAARAALLVAGRVIGLGRRVAEGRRTSA